MLTYLLMSSWRGKKSFLSNFSFKPFLYLRKDEKKNGSEMLSLTLKEVVDGVTECIFVPWRQRFLQGWIPLSRTGPMFPDETSYCSVNQINNYDSFNYSRTIPSYSWWRLTRRRRWWRRNKWWRRWSRRGWWWCRWWGRPWPISWPLAMPAARLRCHPSRKDSSPVEKTTLYCKTHRRRDGGGGGGMSPPPQKKKKQQQQQTKTMQ